MAKYYLDACIWRDYYENRSDKFRPLGEWAFQLINTILNKHEKIVVSDFLIEELKAKYSLEVIENIFQIASENNLLEKVHSSEQQKKLADYISEIRKLFWGDAFHAIIARDNNSILVTRDKHFEKLQDIVEVKKPEELI